MRLLDVTVSGEIFSRKITESRARSRDTRHNSPRLVSISFTPASSFRWRFLDRDEDQEALRGITVGPPVTWPATTGSAGAAGAGDGVVWLGNRDSLEMSRPPFAFGRSWCNTLVCEITVWPSWLATETLLLWLLLLAPLLLPLTPATGLTLLTECLEVDSVDTLSACEWFKRCDRLLTLSWEWFNGCRCVDEGVVADWCAFDVVDLCTESYTSIPPLLPRCPEMPRVVPVPPV